MIIKIDTSIMERFSTAAADLDERTDRRYLYCDLSGKLCVMVIREEIQEEFNYDIEEMTGHCFDCSVGDHPNNKNFNIIGYCRPEYEGLTHTKITLRSRTTEEPDMTLSEFLDGVYSVRQDDRKCLVVGEKLTVELPAQLVNALRRIAAREGETVDTIAYSVLLGYARGNL